MSRQHFFVRVLFGLMVAFCPFALGQCDFEFSDRFNLVGASVGFVTQAVAEPDSLGGRVTIAGGFTPNFPSNIIQWNGAAFSNFTPGYTETSAIYIGYVETGPTPGLYSIRSASGQVSLRRFIAGAWQTVATTNGSSTSKIFIIRENGNDEIYVGINGPNSQSTAPPRILKWNGAALVAVGPNLTPVSSTVLIKDFVLFDDGTGRKPVVGFNNSMPQMLVGGSWQTLGSSATTPSIEDLHVTTVGGVDELWAGGEFSVAGGTNLAKWDGSSWNSVGSPNGQVLQIVDFPGAAGPELFVSGVFTQIGGQMISQSSRLSNGTWLPVPGRKRGIFDQFIRHTVGGNLVLDLVQQTFSGMMQSQNILTVMRWSGTEFVPPEGDGLTGPVFAMLRHDDGAGEKLWIGGSFGNSASAAVRGIATYDGKTIAAPGETQLTPYSSTYTVNALAKFNGQICAGGFFHGITTPSGALVTNSIATWNGSTWSGFGTGVKKNIDPGTINAFAIFDAGSGPELYVGGSFTTAGGVVAANLAAWNGTTWRAVGGGTNGPVNALAVYGNQLFVGGSFTQAGGQTAFGLARSNGTTLTDVLNGLNGITAFINAMHVTDLGNGSKLYVGGSFTSIEGFSTSSIAAWNGTNWSALGIGLADPSYPAVSAITTFDQGDGPALYVGGLFSSAGGVTAAHIARFKNGGWSALDGGLTGSPTFNSGLLAGWAMSPYRNPLGGEALYIGGAFDVADGLPSKFIASWEADPQSNSCAVLGSAADSGVGIGAGGPFDSLRVQGRAGNGHRVNVGIAEPLTISIEQPPTVPYSTGFALFGMLGVPGAGDAYAMPLGVGDFAITPCPVAPLDPLLFVVASDFAIGCAPLVSAGGTPWSLAAPALGFPADVTIQAVVGDLSAPFGLSKTNAVLITVR